MNRITFSYQTKDYRNFISEYTFRGPNKMTSYRRIFIAIFLVVISILFYKTAKHPFELALSGAYFIIGLYYFIFPILNTRFRKFEAFPVEIELHAEQLEIINPYSKTFINYSILKWIELKNWIAMPLPNHHIIMLPKDRISETDLAEIRKRIG